MEEGPEKAEAEEGGRKPTEEALEGKQGDSDAPERPQWEDLDLEGLEIGEGAREPEPPPGLADFEKIEPGPTEVVSFPSFRSAQEQKDDEDPEAERDAIPWLKIAQIGLLVVVNLAVLGVAAYVLYRWIKSEPPQHERLEEGRGQPRQGEGREAGVHSATRSFPKMMRTSGTRGVTLSPDGLRFGKGSGSFSPIHSAGAPAARSPQP